MQNTTARSTVASVSASLLVVAGGLVGAASVATGAGSGRDREVPALDAPTYPGDPWEKRFRGLFWSEQHIHDSWNRCHVGENVPRSLQRDSGC